MCNSTDKTLSRYWVHTLRTILYIMAVKHYLQPYKIRVDKLILGYIKTKCSEYWYQNIILIYIV